MTVPNGAAGINTTDGLFLVSAYGHGDMSPADLVGNDQDTIRAILAGKYVNNGTSVLSSPDSPLAKVFGGAAGLPALLISLVEQLLGINLPDVTDVSSLLDVIEGFPIIGPVIETLLDGLTGNGGGGGLEALHEAVRNINPANVSGVNGPANIRDSIQAQLDAIVSGAVGQQGTGASNADATNVFRETGRKAGQGSDAWEVQGERNNTSISSGLLASSESPFNLSLANAILTITPTASLCTVYRVERSAPLGVVSWIGCGTSGVTAFYLHIRKLNPATGGRVPVFSSPNIVGDLIPGSTPDWEFCNLGDPLPRLMTESYEFEWVTVGGNHSIRGISFTDPIPDHPNAIEVALGATRNSSASPSTAGTIAKAAVVSSPNVPWVEAAIDLGNTSTQHSPKTEYLTRATTVPVPNWVAKINPVVLGKGGDGADGATLGFGGKPGTPGKFNATTWERGVHFAADTIITFEPANDVTGNSVLSVPGYSITAQNGTDGVGTANFGEKPIGKGPGTFEYGDETYPGGKDQDAWGGDGTGPGGAGNGGNYLTGFITGGGKGANGAGWLRFIPGEIEGGTPADVTPPTAPTLITLEASTPSSLTLSVSGGSD